MTAGEEIPSTALIDNGDVDVAMADIDLTAYRVRHRHKPRIGAEWLFARRGVGASNHFEAGGFIRSRAGVEHPDLQYHFLPIAINYDGSNAYRGHGFQAHVGPMRPTSAPNRSR